MRIDHFSSINDMSRAIRRKDVSSVELTQVYLRRLRTLGKRHRAVAEMTEDLAMKSARAADDHLTGRGRPKSKLHGIPFGVKDLLATKGIPTRWGSPGHDDQVFDYDATAVERLKNAGAVLIAKLSMIELAGGGGYNHPSASATGACLSAWDESRWAGGSSSGSGAATALGCVGFSLGSETSGSITCPSAFNGVTGFRGTYGRVSRYGAMALCWTLDKIGPIARSADDCAAVMEVIAGRDRKDRSTLTGKLNLRSRGPKPRIGLLDEKFKENDALDCKNAYEDAVEAFKKLGYETVDVQYPEMPYTTAVGIIVDAEGASAHENFIRGPRFQRLADVNQVGGFAAGMEVRAVDYLWALRMRTEALKANEIWDKCDCVFTPVFFHRPTPIDEPFDKSFRNMGGDYGPANLLGWPTMAFPIGFEEGSPLGGQIIAPAMREDICYRVARDFQKETGWHAMRPTD
ncbi:MAG: amidase [Armatimonadetes bacterium]|nr:amidase [Armatimonadota bacterium]